MFLCYGIIAISLILYAWKKQAAEKRRIEEENRLQLASFENKLHEIEAAKRGARRTGSPPE